MTALYTFNLTVEVEDLEALTAAAIEHGVLVDGLTPEEARNFITEDGVVVPELCLTMLFDPGVSPAGAQIIESETFPLAQDLEPF